MTLVCKPAGRGRWSILTLLIDGKRASPILIRPGQKFVLGGITYRICSVQP